MISLRTRFFRLSFFLISCLFISYLLFNIRVYITVFHETLIGPILPRDNTIACKAESASAFISSSDNVVV